MHTTQQITALKTAQRQIRAAMDAVAPGGRLANSTDESKCTRLWSALSGTRALLIELGPVVDCIATVICTLTNTCQRYERGLQIRNYRYSQWLTYLNDGARYALLDISAALGILNSKLTEESNAGRAAQELSRDDEMAIRRAVWSRALSTNLQDCKCPYPVGHAHREIWVDELMILCKEHHEQILEQTPPPAPVAEELDMREALDIFGMLPLGPVYEAEFIELQALNSDEQTPAICAPH